jgi:hypothetical protein
MRPNLGQVDETIDLAQQVIVWDAPLQTEAVKQRLLHHPPFAHHRTNLLYQKRISAGRLDQAEFFNAIDVKLPFALTGLKSNRRKGSRRQRSSPTSLRLIAELRPPLVTSTA